MDVIVGFVFVAGTLAFMGWALWGRGFMGWRRSVELFGSLLQEPSVDKQAATITGGYEGSAVTVRLRKHVAPWDTGNSAASDCIEIVLFGLPEEIHLSLSHRPGNAFRPGWVPQCNTGDARFDDKFWVEGAPVGWIAAMLAPEIRAWLLDDRVVQIVVEDGVLVWTRYTFFAEGDAAKTVLSHLLSLRAKALALRTQTVEAKMQEAAVSGYRGDVEQASHALDVEKEQAAQFVRDREARRASGRMPLIVHLLFVVTMIGACVWWWFRLHR
jgi:hypothetical protein